MRAFDSGAYRDSDDGKIDPEGFLSPLAIRRYCEYMHKHRRQPDGSIRDADNWQRGVPSAVYMKSLWRHMLETWLCHREHAPHDGMRDALCGVIFNAMGSLHELEKRQMDTVEEQAIGKRTAIDELRDIMPALGNIG